MDIHLFGHSWVQTILRYCPFYAVVHLCETFHIKTLIQSLHYNSRKLKYCKIDIIQQQMISKMKENYWCRHFQTNFFQHFQLLWEQQLYLKKMNELESQSINSLLPFIKNHYLPKYPTFVIFEITGMILKRLNEVFKWKILYKSSM